VVTLDYIYNQFLDQNTNQWLFTGRNVKYLETGEIAAECDYNGGAPMTFLTEDVNYNNWSLPTIRERCNQAFGISSPVPKS